QLLLAARVAGLVWIVVIDRAVGHVDSDIAAGALDLDHLQAAGDFADVNVVGAHGHEATVLGVLGAMRGVGGVRIDPDEARARADAAAVSFQGNPASL